MSPEISEHPRPEDIQQLESVYAQHWQECPPCRRGKSCDIARRMEAARSAAQDR